MSTSAFGQKLRLNVAALISESVVGRLLVCIDEEAFVEDLASKIRGALVKSNIEGRLLRLTNGHGANLPSDEKVGDVLRDAEEVVAVMASDPEDPYVAHQLAGGVGELMSFARNKGSVPLATAIGDESFVTALPSSPVEAISGDRVAVFSQAPKPGPTEAMLVSPMYSPVEQYLAQAQALKPAQVPGPAEVFEEDVLELPASKGGLASVQTRLPSTTDWTVEGLTPKLREYISTRFRDTNAAAAEPGNSFISVSMRPRSRAGAVPSQPVHYSIARIDVMEFEGLCGQRVQETRNRADHFRRCQETLVGLLDKGAHGTGYAPNLLPFRYRDGEKFSDLLGEADMPTFGHVEGFRPTIVIDNSLAAGDSLKYIRSALKRMLYSFLVAKSKFNLLKFSPQGNPVAWANGMVPPTAQVLREAEDFLDGIQPVRRDRSANLLDGMQMALSHPEADVVYVLTSGLPRNCSLEAAARVLKSANVRELPLHIVGVECETKSELELRRLAEANHGSFRHKRFGKASLGSSGSLAGTGDQGIVARVSSTDNDDEMLTIDGQMSIAEILLAEQESQTVDWLEEQKCANRLLLTTASQQPVLDPEQARGMYQRTVLNESKRLLGQGQSHSRLQELVEAHTGRPANGPLPALGAPKAAAAGFLGPSADRQRFAPAQSSVRASSQPRAAAADTLRRPSVVNPWDRPGSSLKTSKLASRGPPGAGGPLPRGRPQSARSRPGSAGRARRQ